MLTLNDIWCGVLNFIYPPKCLVCGTHIDELHTRICTECFGKISYTRFWELHSNPMARHVRDMQPSIENASAMLYYDPSCREIIHRLKYKGEWHIAKYMGELFGAYLASSPLYDSVDVVVPIPLHPVRKLQRGYNQAEYIAQGIASKLGVKVDSHSLYRRRYTSAQALKSRVDRWEGGDGLFGVRHAKSLCDRHILLVDDVYTTGATIFRAVETLQHSFPGCRISIATLATPL